MVTASVTGEIADRIDVTRYLVFYVPLRRKTAHDITRESYCRY